MKSGKNKATVRKGPFNNILSKGSPSAIPADVEPMLATLVSKASDETGWLYEMKWDGYRALSYIDEGVVEIRSRNNKSFNEKFYPLLEELKKLGINALLDGEIVVINQKGLPDFGALQLWRSEADGQLAYFVFDILWYDGINLMLVPVEERRELLKEVLEGQEGMIRLSDNFDSSGKEAFALAEQFHLEGIMAKKTGSLYIPGTRSKEWLKIKTEKRQELTIGGYTRNEGSGKLISALLLGIHDNGSFQFLTPVGTGINTKMQEEIIRKLKPYETDVCPFSSVPEYNKPSRFRPNPPKAKVTWVEPVLVAEISYRELTKEGSIRHPSFKGLREDKTPKQVVREIPVEVVNNDAVLKNHKVIKSAPARQRLSLLNPTDETQARAINGHELKFNNLSKIYWPKDKITKRELINYYYQIAPFILPYLKDRPQTMNRYPNGIEGESFYQKDVRGKVPSWIETFPYFSEKDQREKEFIIAMDEASLLYIASLGCIEINPWHSRKQTPENPDWCIIDLDPDQNSFVQVIEAANVTRQVLQAVDIEGYCKTSGSTGLHIYIPLGGKYSYEDSKEFGRRIAKIVHAELPEFTSIERKVADRSGKMYIDFLQNRPQATVAAPYSVRPKPGATVSMPVHWDEVTRGLKIRDFHIRNAVARAREMGDFFKPVLGKGINLEKVLKKINAHFAV
ncbi:MAG TPA: DNA ligase D [Flavitalea sp.]|nr:DNA ligase D [Flavitalea sp.]